MGTVLAAKAPSARTPTARCHLPDRGWSLQKLEHLMHREFARLAKRCRCTVVVASKQDRIVRERVRVVKQWGRRIRRESLKRVHTYLQKGGAAIPRRAWHGAIFLPPCPWK